MSVPYRSCRDAAAVVGILAELEPRVAIIDIEPLIAFWDTGEAVLDAGIAAFLEGFAGRRGRLAEIVFATNSARRPSVLPSVAGVRLRYVANARKPFQVGAFRLLAGPGVVVGDQIATDGVLAWRLGVTFVHYIPDYREAPVGPRLMRALGCPLRGVLFRRPS